MDTRFRFRSAVPGADGTPRSADSSFKELLKNFKTTSNKGNMLIGESVGRLFRYDQANSSYTSIEQLLDNGRSPQDVRDIVKDHFDVVVLAMANSIRPSLNHTKLAQIIEALDTDVVVLGMGMQSPLEPTLSAVGEGTARLLSVLNEKAKIFGVRGAETKKWLHSVGLTNAEAYGCPTLYVYPQNILGIQPVSSEDVSRVLTSGYIHRKIPRAKSLHTAFRETQDRIAAHYVLQDELFDIPQHLSDKKSFYNDATGACDTELLNGIFADVQRTDLPFRGYWYFQDVNAWRQFTTHFDCYIGDRFHGGVAGLQAGVPGIILHADMRVRELTEHFGIPAAPAHAISTQGVRGLIDSLLNQEALDKFKKRYAWRHHLFRSAVRKAGLELATTA